MAVPFLSVNLRMPVCDFEPQMLAPGVPMLDLPAGQASYRVLRKWLGDLVAEPCWTSAGVMFFLPLDDSKSSAAAHPQCILPRDLRSGPIRAQYLKLWALLSSVQPEAGEVALLSAVCRSFENPDGAARLGQLGDCLFKYRDAQKQWRLVWAWGYRRKAEQLGRASLCRQCSLLSLRKRETLGCPACGWRSRPRLLTAVALALLFIGLGLSVWAATRQRTAQQDFVRHPVAPAPIAQVLPVERPHTATPSVPRPIPTQTQHADETIARIIQPILPATASPRQKLVHPAAPIKPVAPPRPAPIKADPIPVASAASPGLVIPASGHPAAIVAQSSSAPLPSSVRVDPDGKVFLDGRSVTPVFEATTQFSPTGNQPSRYIYGSHVYAESQDTLHSGEPAVQQWQHYVMSDESSDPPTNTDGSGRSVSLVLFDRGTDAEITNSVSPGIGSSADSRGPVHLVQTSASETAAHCNTANRTVSGLAWPSTIGPMPRFDFSLGHPTAFYPTTPHCHSKHRHGWHGFGGYGPYIHGPTVPTPFSRFSPWSGDPALDAKVTVVALRYFGHSSPDEVLADLETARTQAEEQAVTQHNSGARHAILQLCDSEIALWRDVVTSRSTADAATAAYTAGDTQRAGELCQQYQLQAAAYADRPEWSLFETESLRVGALHDKLRIEPATVR